MTSNTSGVPIDHTVPLRDGTGSAAIPGTKLPGYNHGVPPGQKAFPKCQPPAANRFLVHFLLQTCTILDARFREQFLSSNPNPFSFVQRT